jgi:Domain of unknown function (DUF4352)
MRNPGVLCAILSIGALGLSGCASAPAEPPVSTYNLGEKIPVGQIIYTVFETQWMTHFGEGLDARVPQSRFFLVRLNAVNSGSSEATIPDFNIVDDNGNAYQELSNGDGVPQWIGYLRSARPADFVAGNIVFDAPPAHYKLRLSDASGAHKADVDIPLSFGAETPEIVTPGELKDP